MTLALIVTGFALLAFPGWLDHRRRFGPAQFAYVARASMVLGVAGIAAGLTLWGAPAVLHWADAVGVPGLCDAVVHRLPFGGLELAVPMIVLSIAVIGRATVVAHGSRQRAQRARVDQQFGRHRRVGDYDVVVIPSPQLVAVGVPGHQPQIVLSAGIVSELSAPELDAVIRHEAAHHRLRHRQFLLTAVIVEQVFGWIPPVRASAESLRNALEAWADVESVRASQTRIAQLRSALQRLADDRTTTADRCSIERRIALLDSRRDPADPRRSRSVGPWVPSVALGVVGSGALVFTVQMADAIVRCRA